MEDHKFNLATRSGARIWRQFGAALSLAVLLASPALAQRLPRTVFPVHYDLTFAPNLAAETFTGDESIVVSVERPLSAITMNAVGITVQQATITSNGRTQTASVTADAPSQTITLHTPDVIQPGPATIHIAYSAALDKNLRGFYIGRAMGRNYASTQFESTDARRAYPSFDEPEFKATFTLSAIVDDGDAAISNGAEVSDQPGPAAGKHTVRFATTPRISSYLVALTVGPFDCSRDEVDGIPLRVCATRDKAAMTRYALEATKPIVHYYNGYFGIPYAFGKLDLIAIPDFAAGAMENAGAITFREAALLVDSKTATPAQQRSVASVIAHEVAHQWFGDLVTMKWWNDIWLNEGFATFMTPKALDAAHPEWNVATDTATQSRGPMGTDVLRTTRPIRTDASTPAEIDALFDGIAYSKTAAVMRMVEGYVGEDVFRDSVRGYFATNAYGNTAMEDFARAMDRGAPNKRAGEIVTSFVQQPGVPLVTVTERCGDGTMDVAVAQQRMVIDTTAPPAPAQLWSIPICYERNGQRTCEVLREPQQTFHVSGCDPVFVNPNARGYFLTEYAPDVTRRLATASLRETERYALVRDEWFLTRAGRRGVGDYLTLADAFRADRGLALGQILTSLESIGQNLTTPADDAKYRAWVRDYVRPVVTEYGWATRPADTATQRELRTSALAALGVIGRDAATLEKANALAKQAMTTPATLDPSVVDEVFALAAVRSDPALYDMIVAAYPKTSDPVLLRRYRRVLASYRDPKLAIRTLEWAMTPAVRAQDVSSLLTPILGTPEVADAGWEWLDKHWEEVIAKMPAGIGGASPTSLAGSVRALCDRTRRDRAVAILHAHPVPGIDRGLAQAQEASGQCIAMRELQAPKLEEWAR
jgi:aminopeptidase N